MSRGQILVLVAFLAIVGTVVVLVGPSLLGPSRRASTPVWTPVPPEERPSSAPSSPRPVPSPVSAPSPTSLDPVLLVEVLATGGDGRALDAVELRYIGARSVVKHSGAGARVVPSADGGWVGAPGRRWVRLPEAGADGKVHVVLPDASPLDLIVKEPGGAPAVDVPVAWLGPDGKPLEKRTDAKGRVRIDDRGPGVLRAKVGGTERAGPTLLLRIGADREAVASLDPAWTVSGRVLSPDGTPVAGASVRGLTSEGSCGRPVTTAGDGSFQWTGRIGSHVTLVAEAGDGPSRRSVAVEPSLPDPLGALVSTIEVRLPPAGPSLMGQVDKSRLRPGQIVNLEAEPAVLAWVREDFGDAEVAFPVSSLVSVDGAFAIRGLLPRVPYRMMVRGDAVSEDHVVDVAATATKPLRLRPEPVAEAGPVPPSAAAQSAAAKSAANATATIHGKISDAEGRPLAGLTIAGGGEKAVTDAAGEFVLPRMTPGERVHLVWGWFDGTEPGTSVPSTYSPWFEAGATPAPEPLTLTLPKAAALTLTAVNGLDRRPLSYVRVVILDGDGSPRFDDLVATQGGRVTLVGLVPGAPGTLALFAPGLRREVSLALKAGETVDLGEVSLVRGGQVEGVVKDLSGRPLPGVLVAAVEDGRGERGGRALLRERDLELRRATTDAQGAFSLEGLDAGKPAALALVADGFSPSGRRVLWDDEGRAKLSATLQRGGLVRLKVSDPKGKPVIGAAVDLRDGRTGARWLDLVRRAGWGSSIGSSEDVRRASAAVLTEDPATPGTYRVGPAEPGPYEVFVQAPGFRPARARYSIADPEAGSADNPMRLPLDAVEWRLDLEPLPPEGK